MSAQLSQTPKDSKYSFKSVLERLYENDAELVNKMITDFETNKPAQEDHEDILFQMILTTINQLLKAQEDDEDDEEILLKAQEDDEDDEEILLKAQEDDEEILLKAQEDHEEFC